jgi:hypothetical protein
MHAKLLHLLIPFALPSATHVGDLLRDLELGSLEKLLQRADLGEREHGGDFQRTLPHERWLSRRFGVADAQQPDAAPLAPYMLLADGGEPGTASWACIEPVHIQIARDHLVLVDPASLALSRAEAARLLADARGLVEELGLRLSAPDPLRWYVSGTALGTVAGASPLRASGRSIEIWLPHERTAGQAAADAGSSQAKRSTFWMKLQNEVQMAWFEHEVNEQRAARGLQAANSIWLHSQGTLAPVQRVFDQVWSAQPATRGLALAGGTHGAAALPRFADWRAHADGATALVELDALTLPFLHEDWYSWRAALGALEHDWFAPALAALRDGSLAALALTLCGETGYYTLNVTRGSQRKFWRRRTFASLASPA